MLDTIQTTRSHSPLPARGREVSSRRCAFSSLGCPFAHGSKLVVEGGSASVSLQSEDGGYFSVRLSAILRTVPDIAFVSIMALGCFPTQHHATNHDGPHGPSQVIDPARVRLGLIANWPGVPAVGQVLYEMHIGTFTPEGTRSWQQSARLPGSSRPSESLRSRVMPVADFPGRFGWGYLTEPACSLQPRLYGTPDDFRRFVNAAHESGLGVILDVVYNHFGPDGNYIRELRAAVSQYASHRPSGVSHSTSMVQMPVQSARVLHLQRGVLD